MIEEKNKYEDKLEEINEKKRFIEDNGDFREHVRAAEKLIQLVESYSFFLEGVDEEIEKTLLGLLEYHVNEAREIAADRTDDFIAPIHVFEVPDYGDSNGSIGPENPLADTDLDDTHFDFDDDTDDWSFDDEEDDTVGSTEYTEEERGQLHINFDGSDDVIDTIYWRLR